MKKTQQLTKSTVTGKKIATEKIWQRENENLISIQGGRESVARKRK